MLVKICGLTDEASLDAALEAGADLIGLVLAESPRRVDAPTASRLLDRVPAGVLRVAVLRRPGAEELAAVDDLPFDLVQHDADEPVDVRAPRLPAFADGPDLLSRVSRVSRVSPGESLMFLVDGPTGGGRGVPADRARASHAARLGGMVLAGGLTPETVFDAILAVRPAAVDVSSGVEAAPGRKDPARIRAFVGAVREAERAMASQTSRHGVEA